MDNLLDSKRDLACATSSSQRSFPSIDNEVVGFEDDAEFEMPSTQGSSASIDWEGPSLDFEFLLRNSAHSTPSTQCSSPSSDEEIWGFEDDAEFDMGSPARASSFTRHQLMRKRLDRSVDGEVYAFEDDAKSIIQQLTGGTKQLDIVSIVGMPGLGKTTLATKVFTHHFIDKHFDVRSWCSISKECNLRKVCSEILKQVLGNMDGIRDEGTRDKLRRSLMHKRYLIVLDDVWEVEAWEKLRLSFPDDENGSRILLTTRNGEVARQLKHHCDPYFLRFLRVDESWNLLQKKVFQGDICPPELLRSGLLVAKNCKGLPLVIVLIAGILAKEREASVWLEIANDLSSHVLEEQNMKIIESSYDHLEDHLKSCLLYMGSFPEDYIFSVSTLMKLWIAEFFFHNMGLENMEEASKTCLNDLVNRSLVIVSARREDNAEIKYCVVHDVVREFCLRKLKEENFLEHQHAKKPWLCKYTHDDLVKQLLRKYAYLLDYYPIWADLDVAEIFDRCKFIKGQPGALSSSNAWGPEDPEKDLFRLLDNFKYICVLNLLDVNLRKHTWAKHTWATAVQVATHLRYLAIRTEEFDFQWVSHLHDLQTLQVVGNDDQISGHLETSPSIWEMQKLRHVDIQDFSFKWEDNDRAFFEESSETVLPNLKTFGKCRIYLVDKTPEFWWRFPNIEQLKLHFIEPGYEVDMPNLEHLPLLSLELCFSRPISGYKFTASASCVVFPSDLKDLSLDRLYLTEKTVAELAKLRNLESLKLRDVYIKSEDGFGQAGYSICWDVNDYEFNALKYLRLQNIFLTEWRSSEASFPVLEKLILNNCIIQCGQIPCSFADIPTLKLIKLINCDKPLEFSALNIKQVVEGITGCDDFQVLTRTHYFGKADFATDCFGPWDRGDIHRMAG